MTEIKPFGIEDIHLEPCPFCGSEAKLISGKDFIAIYGFVECTHCHVKTEKFFEFVTADASRKDISKAQFKVWNHAAKAWNMRDTDHAADVSKKVERADESAQNVSDSDLIFRKAAIDAVDTIGHIATTADGDKCIRGSAVKYVLSMLPSAQNTSSCAHENDLISRQAAIEAIDEYERLSAVSQTIRNMTSLREIVQRLPSAQPEITDEQAIEHLQSTGWMQNHDREMYESGLREQLADDSGSYDSLIPCDDTISRQAAIDAFGLSEKTRKYGGDHSGYDTRMLYEIQDTLESLPAVQPETHWIPCSERLPENEEYVLISKKPTMISGYKWSVAIAVRMADLRSRKIQWRDTGFGVIQEDKVLAWMPLPASYKGE